MSGGGGSSMDDDWPFPEDDDKPSDDATPEPAYPPETGVGVPVGTAVVVDVTLTRDALRRAERMAAGRRILERLTNADASLSAFSAMLDQTGGELLTTFTASLTTRVALARMNIVDDL